VSSSALRFSFRSWPRALVSARSHRSAPALIFPSVSQLGSAPRFGFAATAHDFLSSVRFPSPLRFLSCRRAWDRFSTRCFLRFSRECAAPFWELPRSACARKDSLDPALAPGARAPAQASFRFLAANLDFSLRSRARWDGLQSCPAISGFDFSTTYSDMGNGLITMSGSN
jgi:hypothetical protein